MHFGKMLEILLPNVEREMFIKILKKLRKKLLDYQLILMLLCKRQSKDILNCVNEGRAISLKDVKRAKIHQF